MSKKYLDNEMPFSQYDIELAYMKEKDKNNEITEKINKKINNIDLEILQGKN